MSLCAENVTLQYGNKVIAEDMCFNVEDADIISIIGPNGSGKSTLLKALGRLLKPTKGVVYLNGKDIQEQNTTEVAKQMAMLPQSAVAPGDMTVYDLVCYGRMPYQKLLTPKSERDTAVVDAAMQATGIVDMQHRNLSTLSGGERQRAWLAMAIAQEPKILLLDEPTTFLDIHHQLEMMKLVSHLHKNLGITVIMVLHDLNHAARFSNRIVAVKDGKIMIDGSVENVFTDEILSSLYGVKTQIMKVRQCGMDSLYCIVDDVVEVCAI